MEKILSIETTRYSEFFRRVLIEYRDGATIEIGRKRYSSSHIPDILRDWCKNSEISGTHHFRLRNGDRELFAFHDHPRELFANISVLPFIEKLQEEKIVRYRIMRT